MLQGLVSAGPQYRRLLPHQVHCQHQDAPGRLACCLSSQHTAPCSPPTEDSNRPRPGGDTYHSPHIPLGPARLGRVVSRVARKERRFRGDPRSREDTDERQWLPNVVNRGPLLKMQIPRAPVHVLVQVSVSWAQVILAEVVSRLPCGKPCSGRMQDTQSTMKMTIGKAGQSANTPGPNPARAWLGTEGGPGGSRCRRGPHRPTADGPEPGGGQTANCTWGSQTAHTAVPCHSRG